jgi:hypothetical protein
MHQHVRGDRDSDRAAPLARNAFILPVVPGLETLISPVKGRFGSRGEDLGRFAKPTMQICQTFILIKHRTSAITNVAHVTFLFGQILCVARS